MNTIILNSKNRDPNSSNRFIYTFLSYVSFTSDDTIAMSSISLYNSIYNIESRRGNNKITLKWYVNATTTRDYVFIIPDGFYDVPALNYYLQFQCIQNGLYAIDIDTTKFIYYYEILTNAQLYKVEIATYRLLLSTEIGDKIAKPARDMNKVINGIAYADWDFAIGVGANVDESVYFWF